MYLTDGYRHACDTGHTCHLEFYTYACIRASRVQNPDFSDADGFFTHSDMAWSLLSVDLPICTVNVLAVTCEMTEHTGRMIIGYRYSIFG
jgi:hypothetical protein